MKLFSCFFFLILLLESITGGAAKDKEESQFITTSVQLESSNMISTTECQNISGHLGIISSCIHTLPNVLYCMFVPRTCSTTSTVARDKITSTFRRRHIK